MYCWEPVKDLHLLKKQQWQYAQEELTITLFCLSAIALAIAMYTLKIFGANSRFFTCQLKIFGLLGLAGLRE